LKSKQGATVVHQVEFDIPTPPTQLKAALPLPVCGLTPALDYWFVRGAQGGPYINYELEKAVEAEPSLSRAQMVEEDPAHPTTLVTPVGVHEIMIAPGLEARIEIGMVAPAEIAERSMKVGCVLRIRIGGSEIGSATEPGIYSVSRLSDLEVTHVQVNCGNHGTARMRHQAETGHKEAGLSNSGPV
jgi:hypothetical protein